MGWLPSFTSNLSQHEAPDNASVVDHQQLLDLLLAIEPTSYLRKRKVIGQPASSEINDDIHGLPPAPLELARDGRLSRGTLRGLELPDHNVDYGLIRIQGVVGV